MLRKIRSLFLLIYSMQLQWCFSYRYETVCRYHVVSSAYIKKKKKLNVIFEDQSPHKMSGYYIKYL
jgi:hypothetical protein